MFKNLLTWSMTMSSGRKIVAPVTAKDIREWEEGWAEMMVTIWRENIIRLKVMDTGRLYNSITEDVADIGGLVTITHQFMLYGIYVARGVGNGYLKENGGNLPFLEKAYRKVYRLGKQRKKRDWFENKYISSIKVLTDVERALYGEAYLGTASNVIRALFGNGKVEGSGETDVTETLRRS